MELPMNNKHWVNILAADGLMLLCLGISTNICDQLLFMKFLKFWVNIKYMRMYDFERILSIEYWR